MMNRTRGLRLDGAKIVWVLAAVAGSAPAFAGEPQINVQQLAVVDRALEFCGPVDSESAKTLREKVAQLVKDVSPDTLARVRDGEDYKQAYASMDGFINTIDARNAKVACANTAKK